MTEVAQGQHIKIHVTSDDKDFGGESVWAIDLGFNMARINNIPFFTEAFSFNDVIRYKIEDGIREFKSVVKKETTSWGVTWEPTNAGDPIITGEEWKKIAKHLRANNVHYESAVAGIFVIALPVDISDEKNIIWLKALKYSCPIELTLYLGDEKDGEEDPDSND